MRLLALTPLLLLASALADDDSWSWGKQRSEPGDQLTSAPSASGSTSVTVIEDILESGRAGKSLEGFGQIYEDPDVQQAITAGNETQARHYIKERLCGLGLMACELDAEGKYLAPQDLIYAQPVHIKPVGRPIPAVPVGGTSVGGYGPPRPVPLPPRPGYGPPPPPLRPYLKKPIYEPEDKPVVVVGGTGGGVQTHVHHHYHHGDKVGLTGVIDTTLDTAPYGSYGTPSISGPPPPGPLYGNSISPTGAGGLYPSGSSYGKPDFYKKQLNLKGSYSSGNGLTGSSSSYSPPSSFNPSSSYNPSQTFNTASSLYSSGSSNYNPGSSNYNSGSSNFNSGSSNYPGSSNYNPGNSYVASTNNYNRYPNYESPRVDSDCFCVPFDQCLPHEIARKEDGYFIDPRTNGGSTIEALGPNDVVITDGNGTMTVVTKPKREDTESKKETEEKKEEEKKEEKKERRRREASDDAVAEATETEERKHKPREAVAEEASSRYEVTENDVTAESSGRQAYYPGGGAGRCGPRQVCCRRPLPPAQQVYRPHNPQCGVRNTQGVHGRIKNPVYVDGDSEFGEYPWQVAILKKDPQESVYVCGGTLIDHQHVLTAAHCVKSYTNFDLRVRLGEWDVNHDVEFYPYVERDVSALHVHPEFYAGTLFNDIALLRLDHPVDFQQSPHISPACLPEPHSEYAGHRCWTTGWGKDAFGDYGKYQNILKEVDVPVVSHHQCQAQLQQTRLGYDFKLHPGFICAGGEEGKDACKGDGGGPMVCERGGTWQLVGVVSWGIGCGQYGVPGVYIKVAHYLDWIRQLTGRF
ncbi:serine proteinase stubble-like isoform X2 [Macrosteles quadrilineatus]|uniref:serine proteinase stubble-like isoform X2 n=1 Tax=Macrosteles quadrilineatus TaxID=74068 RepID=UPI0023E0DBE1|nr:serine proteinase stubble-like isoform X2 [Macrosteles quadrilineatus]